MSFRNFNAAIALGAAALLMTIGTATAPSRTTNRCLIALTPPDRDRRQ
jgi:hypothetical protein